MNCQQIIKKSSGEIKWNIVPFIENVKKVIKSHEIATGKYARRTFGRTELTVDEYGCADAANILYTIGEFPSEEWERKIWIETLQNREKNVVEYEE